MDQGQSSSQGSTTGWSIQNLFKDEKSFLAAKTAWLESSSERPLITSASSKKDLDDEVEWFESKVSLFLNKHAKILRVSPFSKRWWNEKVAEARKSWAKAKKTYGGDIRYKFKLKQARNTYYHIVRKVKRVYWQKF